jgi:hypothetical protein
MIARRGDAGGKESRTVDLAPAESGFSKGLQTETGLFADALPIPGPFSSFHSIDQRRIDHVSYSPMHILATRNSLPFTPTIHHECNLF